MKFPSYIQDLLYDKKKGPIASFFKFILKFLSFLFQGAVKIRNKAFDSGLFTAYFPPVPLVISIGNIVVGGTGKTPATIFLAEEFYDEFKIAILSRGYRSTAEKLSHPVFLSLGKGPLHPASFCGDEPYLIAEKLPKAYVIVGRNRHEASNMAAKLGANLILLDDGMQHRQLKRDLEVVLLDAEDPFGLGHFLPRGLLREEVSSLSRANVIILNHVQNKEQFLNLKEGLTDYPQALIVGSELKVIELVDLKGERVSFSQDESEKNSLEGKKIGLFCAIAKPEKFKQTVKGLKAEVLAEYFIGDHEPFDPLKLENFANDCLFKGIEMILCTEKDLVKFPAYLKVSLPIVSVKVKLQITHGIEEWKLFIKKAKQNIETRL